MRYTGKETGMVTINTESIVPVAVEYNDTHVTITLEDNRRIGVPLDVVPWLRDATPEEREDYLLTNYSVHYNSLYEGIDIEVVLSGWYKPHAS